MLVRILDSVESLRGFPHRNVAEHQSPGLRFPVRSIPVGPYIVYFRVVGDDAVVRVLHVRHAARRHPGRLR